MTIFDELREDFIRWNKSHFDYEHTSRQFALWFANGFKTYIGAPDHYLTAEREPEWYVQPMKVTKNEAGYYKFTRAEGTTDVLERDDDGLWMTGLRFIIDGAPNSFPKSHFTFLLKFIIRGVECQMFIGFENKEFSFPFKDIEKQKLAFEYMVGLLKHALALKPWEFPKKESIGFVPPRVT